MLNSLDRNLPPIEKPGNLVNSHLLVMPIFLIQNYSYNNNLQKIWTETYKNVLDTNTKTTRCLPGDKKLATITNNTNASINFSVGGGKQNKILGFSKIE